jgi:hypothetical protein
MTQEIYSSIPIPGMPAILHRQLQSTLINELLGLIERAQDILGLPLNVITEKVNKLANHQDAISPDVYGFHSKLLKALTTGDGVLLKKTVTELLEYPANSLTVSSFTITTFDETVPSDSSILDYVFGSEGPRSRRGDMPAVHPISGDELANQSPYVEEAFRVIRNLDEDLYEELEEYTSSIVLFDGRVLVGLTSMRAFGKIYIQIPAVESSRDEKVAYYIEHIVHEGAHLHLHGIMMHDRLVLNPDDERYPAPIRADLRPMYGIFHATFVLSRMARVFKMWKEASGLQIATAEYQRTVDRFERGYETLTKYARLTDAGKVLVATLRETALMSAI